MTRVVATVDSGAAHVVLVVADDGNDVDRRYAVDIADRAPRPLNGLTSARLAGYWTLDGRPVLVVEGSARNCEALYDLIAVGGDGVSEHRLPCSGHYDFAVSGDALRATETDAVQPRTWTLRDGDFAGPMPLVASHAARRPRQAAANVEEAGGVAPELAETLRPPVVHGEVGNEVIPALVSKAATAPTIVRLH